MKTGLFSVAIACLAGCASVSPARMATPPGLGENPERIAITGAGGARAGAFAAGPFSGSFERSETRLALFDPLIERRSGWTRFSLAGPDINGRLEIDCAMRQRALALGPVSIEPEPMTYACTIDHEGRRLPARFELADLPSGIAGPLRAARRGEIALAGALVQVRSEHRLEGSALPLATPSGYVFERDGRTLGALDLNGAPAILFGSAADLAERRAILVAALALALFWDPAGDLPGH